MLHYYLRFSRKMPPLQAGERNMACLHTMVYVIFHINPNYFLFLYNLLNYLPLYTQHPKTHWLLSKEKKLIPLGSSAQNLCIPSRSAFVSIHTVIYAITHLFFRSSPPYLGGGPSTLRIASLLPLRRNLCPILYYH